MHIINSKSNYVTLCGNYKTIKLLYVNEVNPDLWHGCGCDMVGVRK
jgi:hypothetical protein